jgi:DNA-binding Lrp family transcriptional regulator
MSDDYYRGYLLVRLAKIGTEWEISDKMMAMSDDSGEKNWDVTFACPIYGAWDLMVEISFKQLENLDQVVTSLRADEEIRDNIEETTTLVSSKPNYNEIREKFKKK